MDALELSVMLLAGLGAGALSTVAGMGGGILLVVSLALAIGPHAALATTAPALLIGNLHRLWIYRRALNRKIALMFALGALPGAFVGGIASAGFPEQVLQWILLGVSLFALARAAGYFTYEPRPSAYVPFAFGAGMLAASSGAGIIVSPMLVAGGLTGEALIATASAAAVVMHVGRIAGYGVGGLLGGATLLVSCVLGAGIFLGNLVGQRVRVRIGEEWCMRSTWAALAISAIGAFVGIVAR
jgi:uncharacterized membrane protein YfcA